MITGRKTFEGKSRVLLMSAIATAELPPLSSIQPASSSALDHLVRMCLAKDPSDRWQTARDLLAELRWIAAGGAGTSTNRPASTAGRRSRLSLALAAGVAALSLVTAAATWLFQGPVEAAASRVHIPTDLPTGGRFNGALPGSAFAVSPDGRMLAFTPGSARPMHVRLIGALAAEPRPGTEGASHPFWSPDSRFVAFVSGGKLMQMEAKGGPPRPICDAPDFAGGDWNADGTIIFGTTKGLFRVPADGGRPPEPLTTTNAQESAHYWPHFLPDGRAFLYLAWSAQPGGHKLFAGSLDSKERTEVMLAESKVAYVEPGYLVFARETALYARRFDANSFSVWGEAERVADGILQGPRGGSSFSVARSGALVYYYIAGGGRAATADNLEWQLSWVDRENGQQVAVAGHFGPYLGAEASPDGSKIAVHKHEGTGGDIFVIEPGATTQLTFDASRDNSSPIWSPHDDGETIVYSSRQNGMWGLYRTRSDGSGSPELLWESELPKAPMSWSPDGKRLVFSVQDPKTMGDVWVLTLDDRKAERLVATQFNETHPQISYDGNWMAYTSNRQRGRNEIFVQPFPKGEGILYVISRDGGDWPRWKRDGTELFFHALISGAVNPGAILAAPVDGTRPAFGHWDPREVLVTLAVDLPHPAGGYSTYGVSPDGKQFLVPQQVVRSDPATGTGQTSAADPAFGLVAALNWTTALRK
jgi:Tol biopolymer transport system component